MKEILSAPEAARILGIQPKVIRFNLEKGIWKFGVVIPPKVTGKKENTYHVYARQMCEFFGIPFESEENTL